MDESWIKLFLNGGLLAMAGLFIWYLTRRDEQQTQFMDRLEVLVRESRLQSKELSEAYAKVIGELKVAVDALKAEMSRNSGRPHTSEGVH